MLLNQYTVAGTQVPSSYNNQQDYINRIPALANDAMREIATTMRKIPAQLDLADLEPEDLGEMLRYELPSDFYNFKSGGTSITTDDGTILHTSRYSYYGKKYILIPKAEAGDYTITYFRYPTDLPEKPSDDVELDNEVETHDAAAYYVAAFLVIDDDAFKYAAFYNKYEDKLAKMGPGTSIEMLPVADAYGFYDDGI
jgi:hypothetical protein